jgi:hypothetical protein
MDVIGVLCMLFGATTFVGGVALARIEGGTTARSSRYAAQEFRRLGLGFALLGVVALCVGLFLP